MSLSQDLAQLVTQVGNALSDGKIDPQERSLLIGSLLKVVLQNILHL